MRLFLSGIRKLVRRPASWVSAGLLIGLLALIVLAVGATANSGGLRASSGAGGNGANAKLLITFPGAYDRILQFVTGLGGLFAVIYGAAIAGSEWSWGTLKAAVARGESRVQYMLISYASVAAMLAAGVLVTFGVGVEEGALGFTIATLARSQLAGIGAGIAFYFAEGFASIFLPDIIKYMPFSVANASLVTGSGTAGMFAGGASGLPVDQAQVFVALWLVGVLIIAALFSDRAEIAG